MHDHSGHSTGGLNLLPIWIQAAWVLVMAVVVAAHVLHAATATGLAHRQIRVWHATHVLMGIGMLYMFAPWSGDPGGQRLGQYGFTVAAIGVLAWVGGCWQRGQRVDTHWVLSALGLAAMAYMFAMHRGSGTPAVTYLVVAYYLAETAGWAQGWLTRCTPSVVPASIGPGAGAPAVPLRCSSPRSLRICQSAMALAMGYMFLAMDRGAAEFFEQAYGQPVSLGLNADVGVTEQTLWASCLVAVVVLACVPRRRESVLAA